MKLLQEWNQEGKERIDSLLNDKNSSHMDWQSQKQKLESQVLDLEKQI